MQLCRYVHYGGTGTRPTICGGRKRFIRHARVYPQNIRKQGRLGRGLESGEGCVIYLTQPSYGTTQQMGGQPASPRRRSEGGPGRRRRLAGLAPGALAARSRAPQALPCSSLRCSQPRSLLPLLLAQVHAQRDQALGKAIKALPHIFLLQQWQQGAAAAAPGWRQQNQCARQAPPQRPPGLARSGCFAGSPRPQPCAHPPPASAWSCPDPSWTPCSTAATQSVHVQAACGQPGQHT